jgi:uncharacterized protein YbaA (DUF1428 family)
MKKYIDGFLLVVPRKNFNAYHKMAKEAGRIWLKCGALDYKECVGDDMNPKMDGMGLALTFPKMAKTNKNETVWFSFIVYKSKAHRDQVNKKVMAEMNKNEKEYNNMVMPFDMKRFAYGGFSVIVDMMQKPRKTK